MLKMFYKTYPTWVGKKIKKKKMTFSLSILLTCIKADVLCDPIDCSPPGSFVHGILQARILEWVTFPPPGDLLEQRIKPTSLSSPSLAGWFFPDCSAVNNQLASGRDLGSIPGSGKTPGGRHGNPFQYSCLENPMDKGAWQATVHGVAKESDTIEMT